MPTPTTCPARPTSRPEPAPRSASASTSREVQRIFRPVFNAADCQARWQRLRPAVRRRRALRHRHADIEVIATPGHTPADVSYRIGDAVFVGDTLFMPDYGTARADFPGGDARKLYRSIRRCSACRRRRGCSCATTTRRPAATDFAWETTVRDRAREQRPRQGWRRPRRLSSPCAQARDATLAAPRLLLPSIQVNIRAGRFPPRRGQRRPLPQDPAEDDPGRLSHQADNHFAILDG